MATGNYKTILPRVIEQLPLRVTAAAQTTGLLAGEAIVDRTPVRTGRARANWRALINSADPPVTNDTDPSGSATIARMTGDVQALKLGQTLSIVNAVPYIGQLENGSSKQAPSGMVALVRLEVPDIFERAMKAALK